MEETIKYIDTAHIHPHPDNPRKDIGDISELTESIKKNGIMQNLTVIPMDEPEEYMLLIGHRRHAAAVAAGIEKLPCKIVENLTKREQVAIMLEENMQRNDLTILEQAQGFQMMLDLGETVDGIAEKTGFSKTTIYHRLNIGKLDPQLVRNKQEDDEFQLSIKDLCLLEQIEDIEKRNEILKDASNSQQLVWKVRGAVEEQRLKRVEKALVKLLFDAGVKPAPANAAGEIWSSKWEQVKRYELDSSLPKRLGLSKEKGELYFIRYFRQLYVIRKAEKVKKRKTPEEIKAEKRNLNRKVIQAISRELSVKRKKTIEGIISGKIPPAKDESRIKDDIWKALMELGIDSHSGRLCYFFLDDNFINRYNDESKRLIDGAKAEFEKHSTIHQMLIALHKAMECNLADYAGRHEKATCEKLIRAYSILTEYGWVFEEEELKLLDGSSELYWKDGD